MEEQVLTHPSYVTVRFSRCSGNPRLFGSSLDTHYGYVSLEIDRAELIRTDHDDRVSSHIGGQLVRVELSEAQFATLLTTMNVASGTPGTLQRFNGKSIPDPPKLHTKVENVKARFDEDMRARANAVLTDAIPRAQAILDAPSLKKADRAELMGILTDVANLLNDHVPFILEMMDEAVGERVVAAKAEIAATVTRTLTRLGQNALGGHPMSMDGMSLLEEGSEDR
jgi:hypothetical protein